MSPKTTPMAPSATATVPPRFTRRTLARLPVGVARHRRLLGAVEPGVKEGAQIAPGDLGRQRDVVRGRDRAAGVAPRPLAQQRPEPGVAHLLAQRVQRDRGALVDHRAEQGAGARAGRRAEAVAQLVAELVVLADEAVQVLAE